MDAVVLQLPFSCVLQSLLTDRPQPSAQSWAGKFQYVAPKTQGKQGTLMTHEPKGVSRICVSAARLCLVWSCIGLCAQIIMHDYRAAAACCVAGYEQSADSNCAHSSSSVPAVPRALPRKRRLAERDAGCKATGAAAGRGSPCTEVTADSFGLMSPTLIPFVLLCLLHC